MIFPALNSCRSIPLTSIDATFIDVSVSVDLDTPIFYKPHGVLRNTETFFSYRRVDRLRWSASGRPLAVHHTGHGYLLEKPETPMLYPKD